MSCLTFKQMRKQEEDCNQDAGALDDEAVEEDDKKTPMRIPRVAFLLCYNSRKVIPDLISVN